MLSSSVTLTERLVTGLRKKDPSNAGRGDRLTVHGPEVLDILTANFDVLCEQRVVEDGIDLETAQLYIGNLLKVLEAVDRLEVTHEDSQDTARWRIALHGRAR